jgi:serine/threonine-protein kinase
MIEFHVLGTLGLRGPEGVEILSVLAQPKRTAVLTYLAVASPRGFHRRDKIATLFWPESDQEHARGALRQSLHFLRRSMGDEALPGRGGEEVGLDPQLVWVDVTAFEGAVTDGDLETALDLYRGEFLEGFFLPDCPEFDRWVEEERARLRGMAADSAWQLAGRRLDAGSVVEGERLGQTALSLDPTGEARVREFIMALATAGDRAAAVGFFETFARWVREELELEPSAETLAVVESLRESGDGPEVASSGAEGGTRAWLETELGSELEILRRLGTGSVSEVFLARQRGLGRLVAVKVLSPDIFEDPVARTRFEREARAAASLHHPNAVTVYRFGVLGNQVPFLTMAYVKGNTLEERLAAEGPLAVSEVRRILAELAGALEAAHRSGFVHRDVRPANVLWDQELGRALLTDFGLAGILPEREGSLPRVTRAGEILGDLAYVSPEQFRGEDPTEGADIYALGVMGYVLLTGEGPFQAKNEREMATAHMRWRPPPLTALRDDVDEGLADLLGRCLAKEAGKRPGAAFLAKALQELGGKREGEGGEEARKAARRRQPTRLEMALFMLLAVILVVLGIVVFG